MKITHLTIDNFDEKVDFKDIGINGDEHKYLLNYFVSGGMIYTTDEEAEVLYAFPLENEIGSLFPCDLTIPKKIKTLSKLLKYLDIEKHEIDKVNII